MAFTLPLDIANRAAQMLGARRFTTYTESREAKEMAAVYDHMRLVETERNLWRFATRSVVLRSVGIDSVLWTPPTWAAGTFSIGDVVSYTPASGVYSGITSYWQTTAAKTVSNTTTPDLDSDWHHYAGPVAFDLYDSDVTYHAGELVLVPSAWSGATTYAANAVIYSGTTFYVSLVDSNLNHAVTDTAYWVEWTSTGRGDGNFGQTATDSPLPLTYPGSYSVYLSLYNSNADNPLSATGNWLSLGGTVVALQFVYPIGTGPSTDNFTANCFRLPNGFLKRAPTDPKANQIPYLGAASGANPDDWEPEGRYITSRDPGPILLRFVADITDVTEMNPLFCEGLAARIAIETCETITQAQDKLAACERNYNRAISDARRSNAIEIGPISPVENRYIVVRA